MQDCTVSMQIRLSCEQILFSQKLLTHYRGVPDGKSREIFAEKFDVGRLDRRTGTPNEEVDPKTETEAQNGDRPVQKLEGSNQPQRGKTLKSFSTL